jgi:hypothetical protein
MTGGDGITRKTAAGREYDSMPMSSLPVSMALESSVRGSIQKGASEATRAARSDSVAESQRVGSQLAELDQLNHQLSRDQGFRDSVNKSSAADFQRSYGETTAMLDKLREGTSLSRSETAQLMFNSDANLSGSASIGTPGGSPLSASAGVGAQIGGSYQSGDRAAREKVLDRAKELGYSTTFGTALATTLRAGSELAGSYSGSDLQSYAKSASSQLSREAGVTTATTASVERAKSFEEARQLSNSDSFGSRTQLDDKFKNWLASKLGDQNAALALIREGAQGNNPAAQAELSAHMREFAGAYAEQIAGSIGPLSPSPISTQGEAWMAGVKASGEAASANLRTEGTNQVHTEAGADRLDAGSIDGQSEAARSGGQSEKDRLTQDLWKQEGVEGIKAVATKRNLEHEAIEAEKKSLTGQVMLEKLKLPPPNDDGSIEKH